MRSTWHRCHTTTRPTSAILDDRRVQFTCESRASRPARPLPLSSSYPRVVLLDANKIPGARRKSWPGRPAIFVWHTLLSFSLSFSFRGYANARAVVCVVVRPGDYAVARGPFPPPPLRLPRPSSFVSSEGTASMLAHTHTWMRRRTDRATLCPQTVKRGPMARTGRPRCETSAARGKRGPSSRSSNRFGHANARSLSLSLSL